MQTRKAISSLDEAFENRNIYKIQNFIDNEHKVTKSGQYVPSYQPARGEIWAEVPDSDVGDVDMAVSAAQTAFTSWSQTSVQYRSSVLLKIASIIEDNLNAFAKFESIDQGKPVSLAKTVDIPRCVHNFRFFATTILHATDKSIHQHEPVEAINYVTRQPVGVCGLISPWNLPLYLLSFKIAPAIAAGNTVVCKPSELTSVTAWLLSCVFIDAGLPPGVVNLVFGTGPKAGQALVTHALVPLISFTGSTLVGRMIQELTAPMTKKLSLEMGGKNACLVFEDADLESALPVIVRSCFANQGEICLCTSRLFVHESIFNKFITSFVTLTKKLIVSDPNSQNTDLGALVSKEHMMKVQRYMKIASEEPNTIVHCGGIDAVFDHLPDALCNGYYVAPTIVSGMGLDSPLMKEEIFGPVVCVVNFKTLDQVVHMANDTEYGLSASIWSSNVHILHKTAHRLNVGTVWCNCWLVRDLNMPFGGMKASGIGREGSEDSFDFFTEKKTICIKM